MIDELHGYGYIVYLRYKKVLKHNKITYTLLD